MAKENFDLQKNGFDKDQVMSKLNRLDKKIKEYQDILVKKENIITDLKSKDNTNIDNKKQEIVVTSTIKEAVDTAKKIEKERKDIYRKELEKLAKLNHEFQSLIKSLIQKDEKKFNSGDIASNLEELNTHIKTIYSQSKKTVESNKQKSDENVKTDIQRLLGKMGSTRYNSKKKSKKPVLENQINMFHKENKEKQSTNIEKESYNKNNPKSKSVKSITKLTLNDKDKYDNLAEKYLNTTDDDTKEFAKNAYAKQILKKEDPKNKGFDLKEAISPTEDLEEIMKAFETDKE